MISSFFGKILVFDLAVLVLAVLLSAGLIARRVSSMLNFAFIYSVFVSCYLPVALSCILDWADRSQIEFFLLCYAALDLAFLLVAARSTSHTKFFFMLALLVGIAYNWACLLSLKFGIDQLYINRPIVISVCLGLQLLSITYTLIRGDDDNDSGIRAKFDRRHIRNQASVL